MPSPLHRPRWPWLLLLPLLAVLGLVQGRLQVDAHNESMKAPDSAEAVATRRLVATFGGENAIALAFVARTHDEVAALEGEALATLAARLRTELGVRGVDGPLPAADDVAVLVADLAPTADGDALVALARAMCPPTLRLLPAGAPLAEAAIARGVAADRQTLLPLIAGALLLLALCMYASIAHALAALLPATLAILVIGSLQHWSGLQLDPIGVLLEPVLLTVGVATAVHWLSAYRRERERGHAAAVAIQRTRAALVQPTTLATATTMLGFWSLALHPIPAVADFGRHAGLGTALVHALTLLLLPRWVASFPGRIAATAHEPTDRSRRYVAWLLQRRGLLFAVIVATAAGAANSWLSLHVDNDPMRVLPTGDPFRRDLDEFCSRLGGAETFAILVDHDSPAATIDRLMPFVAAAAETPPASGLAAPPRIGVDGTVMVPVRLMPSGSRARSALFAGIEERARHLGYRGVTVAGLSVQIARDSDRLVRGQLLGMAVTALGLFFGLWIGLRSWRLAALGLVPNLLPCALLYGGLSALGQPLTVASAMIGSVMLGLIVDNTIHLLHHVRHARGTPAQRTATALAAVARPMLISSAVLSAGFGVGAAGAMTTTHDFALLSAATIAFALIGTGLVLPVLLLTRMARKGMP